MTFLSEWQLEYIKLIFGLAFFIIATVCFSMSKAASRRLPWVWFGLSVIAHGLGIWAFNLSAGLNDFLSLPVIKTLLMSVSCICLAEFGRAGIVSIKGRGPGRWSLLPIILLAVLTVTVKPGAGQAALLYMLGLAGGLTAAGALSLAAGNSETCAARWLKMGSKVILLYMLLAGLLILLPLLITILPGLEPFFDTVNFLLELAGIILILWMAAVVWGYSQEMFSEDNGDKYLYTRSRYALLAAAILIIVLGLGWNLTRYLESNARDNLRNESDNKIAALSGQLLDDLNEADHAAAVLAGENQLAAALLSGKSGDMEQANQVLDRYHNVLESPVCSLIDIKGTVIASSNRNDRDSYVGHNYSFRSYFREALAGNAGHYFALGVTSGERGYYTRWPVRDAEYNIIGAVAIKRNIGNMEYVFKQYSPYFLIDPHGIIFLSSRQDMIFMSLWSLNEETQQALTAANQFGVGPFQAVRMIESAGGKDVIFEGRRYIQTRKFINEEGWSFVLLAPTAAMRAAWLPGLIITLFLSLLTNVFFLAAQRSNEETARLSISGENYRSVFETTRAATCIVEEDCTFSLVNKEFAVMAGYTKEELESKKSWTDFAFGEGLEMMKKYHRQRRVNSDAAPRTYEVRLINRYGIIKNMLITVDIIQGTRKSVVSAVDITERKQAEESLRVSEQRFSKIFNSNPNLMSITTLAEGRYVEINERFTQIMGYAAEEIIGRTSTEINIWVRPERPEVVRMLQENGLINNLECVLRKKSGEVYTGLYSAEIVDFNGELFILSAVTDITERKRLEEEMARLERLNLIGEMAAGIGHEIRNPMTTVRGFLQLLGSKKDSAHYREYYDLMIDELDRANTIITEFLSLAKNRTVNKKMLSLNSIVEVLFPLIQADALRTDKFIQTEVADIPDLLLDEKEIRQLLLNLVRNGLEAMPPGGRITIKTFMEGENVVLAVQDEGKGIEPEVLEKLGTPFYTTKDSGTGLGLAVCYSIAAGHNATIQVETGPTGTIFYVVFTP